MFISNKTLKLIKSANLLRFVSFLEYANFQEWQLLGSQTSLKLQIFGSVTYVEMWFCKSANFGTLTFAVTWFFKSGNFETITFVENQHV